MKFQKNPREYREIIQKLGKLHPTPPRQQQATDSGRNAFLKSAESLGSPVSISLLERLNMWLQMPQIRVLVYRTLTTLLITLFFICIGGSVTVYAAQDAFPGDRIYGVKVWSEDARLWLTVSPKRDLDLHLEFIRDRLDEMRIMMNQEQIEELDRVTSNFFKHLQDAKCLVSAVQNQKTYRSKIKTLEQEFKDLFAPQEFETEAKDDADDDELEEEADDDELEDEYDDELDNDDGLDDDDDGLDDDDLDDDDDDEDDSNWPGDDDDLESDSDSDSDSGSDDDSNSGSDDDSDSDPDD